MSVSSSRSVSGVMSAEVRLERDGPASDSVVGMLDPVDRVEVVVVSPLDEVSMIADTQL
jgi:hypothetical protein